MVDATDNLYIEVVYRLIYLYMGARAESGQPIVLCALIIPFFLIAR
jgi:hypothetical protein